MSHAFLLGKSILKPHRLPGSEMVPLSDADVHPQFCIVIIEEKVLALNLSNCILWKVCAL